MPGPEKIPVDDWKDLSEFVRGLAMAGSIVRLAASSGIISLDEVPPELSTIVQLSEIFPDHRIFPMTFSTSTSVDGLHQSDVLDKFQYEARGMVGDIDMRLEDANGNKVKFPIRVVLEEGYS